MNLRGFSVGSLVAYAYWRHFHRRCPVRTAIAVAVILTAIAAFPAAAAAPKHTTLEDWKAHRAAEHADTLIVTGVSFDSTWASIANSLLASSHSITESNRTVGHLTTAWDEELELPPYHGAEYSLTEGASHAGLPPAFTSPECPNCWFKLVSWRRVIDVEHAGALRVRVIARSQFVGVPRGQTDPIALVSSGSTERAFLNRLRAQLGQ